MGRKKRRRERRKRKLEQGKWPCRTGGSVLSGLVASMFRKNGSHRKVKVRGSDLQLDAEIPTQLVLA
jgi:hypothetical protein